MMMDASLGMKQSGTKLVFRREITKPIGPGPADYYPVVRLN
jgi:hypothetical protein